MSLSPDEESLVEQIGVQFTQAVSNFYKDNKISFPIKGTDEIRRVRKLWATFVQKTTLVDKLVKRFMNESSLNQPFEYLENSLKEYNLELSLTFQKNDILKNVRNFASLKEGVFEKRALESLNKDYRNAIIIEAMIESARQVLPDSSVLKELPGGGRWVEEVIGSGSFGTVYKVNGLFALKEQPTKHARHEAFVGKQLINNLVLEGIPNFLYTYSMFGPCSRTSKTGWCENDSKESLYVLSELITGVSLDEFISSETTLDEIYDISIQLFSALRVAYERFEFTHNDLHSENVIIQTFDTVQTLKYAFADGSVVKISTKVVPVIIDYGYSNFRFGGVFHGFGETMKRDKNLKDLLEYGYYPFPNEWPFVDTFKVFSNMLKKLRKVGVKDTCEMFLRTLISPIFDYDTMSDFQNIKYVVRNFVPFFPIIDRSGNIAYEQVKTALFDVFKKTAPKSVSFSKSMKPIDHRYTPPASKMFKLVRNASPANSFKLEDEFMKFVGNPKLTRARAIAMDKRFDEMISGEMALFSDEKNTRPKLIFSNRGSIPNINDYIEDIMRSEEKAVMFAHSISKIYEEHYYRNEVFERNGLFAGTISKTHPKFIEFITYFAFDIRALMYIAKVHILKRGIQSGKYYIMFTRISGELKHLK